MKFTVHEIVEASGGRLLRGDVAADAGRVVTDTRTVAAGETFLALRGIRFDAHAFLGQAAEAGAACVVVDDAEGARDVEGPAVVLVEDTLAALGRVGAAARERVRCPVIAVTGSCGKTTTKEMIGQVLDSKLRGRTPEKSYNNAVGVPLTLLAAESDDEFLLVELGTNAPGEIAALATVARPTIGVVTLVAEVHLEGLGSIEGVAREKAALVEALPPDGLAVLNADDPRVAAMAHCCRGRVITVGLEAGADLRAEDVAATEEGLRFRVGGVAFGLPVLGRHQGRAALVALAVAREMGLEDEDVAAALARFRAPPMRLAVLRAGDVVVVDDAYNANPASMRAALDLLALWPDRRKVFFAGTMLELGPASREAHQALGRDAVRAGVERLVAVGAEADATIRGAREAGLREEAAATFEDADAAAAEAVGIVEDGDVVLVKGSRAAHMEKVVDALRRCPCTE